MPGDMTRTEKVLLGTAMISLIAIATIFSLARHAGANVSDDRLDIKSPFHSNEMKAISSLFILFIVCCVAPLLIRTECSQRFLEKFSSCCRRGTADSADPLRQGLLDDQISRYIDFIYLNEFIIRLKETEQDSNHFFITLRHNNQDAEEAVGQWDETNQIHLDKKIDSEGWIEHSQTPRFEQYTLEEILRQFGPQTCGSSSSSKGEEVEEVDLISQLLSQLGVRPDTSVGQGID